MFHTAINEYAPEGNVTKTYIVSTKLINAEQPVQLLTSWWLNIHYFFFFVFILYSVMQEQ